MSQNAKIKLLSLLKHIKKAGLEWSVWSFEDIDHVLGQEA